MVKINKKILALIISGASAATILGGFLDDKEGNHSTAYRDGGGKPTICRGITSIEGNPVRMGLTLTAAQCDKYNAVEAQKAITWVEKNVKIPLTEPQKAGIASFCPYNIGPGKCFPSTFFRKLNTGDRLGACAEIKRWIYDGGKDCRLTKGQKNGCYGQVERRDQESALACWGIDK